MQIRNATIVIILGAITLLAWYFSRTNIISSQEPEIDTLIIGTNAEFAPFTFIENDEIVGFDIDIAKEIAKRLDKKIKFKNMSFVALIPEIQLGSIHIIAAGMTPTLEREKRVFFTQPHFDKDPLIAVQPLHKEKINQITDLANKSVIVNQGYTADRYVSGIKEIKDVTRLSSGTVSTAMLALQSGKADAYIASYSSLQPYLEKYGTDGFQFTPLSGTEELYALAVSKKYPKLYEQIQATIAAMEKDGTLKSLRDKWFPASPAFKV